MPINQLRTFGVKFMENEGWPKMHRRLNDAYSVEFDVTDDFYTDGTRANFLNDVVDLVRAAIIDQVIMPEADDGTDRADVARIIDDAALKIAYGTNRGNGSAKKRRFTRQALTAAAEAEQQAQRHHIELIMRQPADTAAILCTDGGAARVQSLRSRCERCVCALAAPAATYVRRD